MDLASGYSDSINYGNGYTPLANNAIANNNASYAQQQAVMALMAQQAMDQHNAAIQAQGPSSGYGMVGGYPSFGDPAPAGTYSPGSGRSTFSGTPTAPQQPAPNTATMFDGMSPADMATWQRTMYNAGRGSEIPQQYQGGGIGSDAARSPNQPGNAPIPSFWQGVRDWTGMTSGAPSYEAPAPTPQSYGPGYFDNTFGSAYANQQKAINSKSVDWDKTFNTITAPYTPQTYSGGGIGSDVFNGMSAGDRDIWTRTMQQAGRGNEIPSFWQGVRDYTGMGQPGGSGYDPYAGLGNQGQQGVIDPMGYGTGGYQGNAIPNQQPQQQQQQQPNNLPWFWQGVRDVFGADPKDQSRIPQSDGGYPGATNPNYQPGGMAPQQPFQPWMNAS